MEPSAQPPAAAANLPSRYEFDERAYLDLYPDVARDLAAGAIDSGWRHFIQHGCAEGRQWVRQADPLAGVSREIAPGDEMFTGNEAHYFDVGISALRCIEAALAAIGRPASGVRKVLDLPCGHGRVMRFLRGAFPSAELTACDLNADGVAHCARAFGAVPVVSRREIGAIPLASAEFDLIWCGSLLTHFPQEQWHEFLALFRRVLRPGGIVVFTTHGRGCAEGIVTGRNRHGLADDSIARLLAEYRRTGFGYVDYAAGAAYGFSLSHPAYVTGHLIDHPGWRLTGYHENGWDQRQDVICLQRTFA